MVSTDFRLGDFVVQPQADRILNADGTRHADLEPRTMAVLVALAGQGGRVVSSEELVRDVWHDRPMGDNPVYKVMAKLRRALGDDAGRPRYIETIPRKGYRLMVEPAPLESPWLAQADAQRERLTEETHTARWALPGPLARLAAMFALLLAAAFLVSAGGSGGHAPVRCESPAGSGAVTETLPSFRGFDAGDVSRSAAIDVEFLDELRVVQTKHG